MDTTNNRTLDALQYLRKQQEDYCKQSQSRCSDDDLSRNMKCMDASQQSFIISLYEYFVFMKRHGIMVDNQAMETNARIVARLSVARLRNYIVYIIDGVNMHTQCYGIARERLYDYIPLALSSLEQAVSIGITKTLDMSPRLSLITNMIVLMAIHHIEPSHEPMPEMAMILHTSEPYDYWMEIAEKMRDMPPSIEKDRLDVIMYFANYTDLSPSAVAPLVDNIEHELTADTYYIAADTAIDYYDGIQYRNGTRYRPHVSNMANAIFLHHGSAPINSINEALAVLDIYGLILRITNQSTGTTHDELLEALNSAKKTHHRIGIKQNIVDMMMHVMDDHDFMDDVSIEFIVSCLLMGYERPKDRNYAALDGLLG